MTAQTQSIMYRHESVRPAQWLHRPSSVCTEHKSVRPAQWLHRPSPVCTEHKSVSPAQWLQRPSSICTDPSESDQHNDCTNPVQYVQTQTDQTSPRTAQLQSSTYKHKSVKPSYDGLTKSNMYKQNQLDKSVTAQTQSNMNRHKSGRPATQVRPALLHYSICKQCKRSSLIRI